MLQTEITLPPASRPPGGLLAAARPLSGEWWRGVAFRSDGCVEPILRGPCIGEAHEDAASRPGWARFAPVTIRQGAVCSAMTGDDQTDLAEARLEVTQEWALARALQTGSGTEHVYGGDADDSPGDPTLNPNLEGCAAEPVAGPLEIVDALACLEQQAADGLFGGTAFIHASPQLGTHLLAASAIWRDGVRWRTANGNVVIVSPGYSGVDLFATAEVFAAVGQRNVSSALHRSTNDVHAWADEVGIAVFDPCWCGRVTVDVAECGESPA